MTDQSEPISDPSLEAPAGKRMSERSQRMTRNLVLLGALLVLVIVRLWSNAASPKFLPGSGQKQRIVGPAKFAEYCARTYSGSSFHQTGEGAESLVCSDRSSALWQTQPITPDQVCLFEYPDSNAARTKQTGDAEKDWSCTKPSRR